MHALDAAIAALDAALARNPDDATLIARRAALIAERANVARGGDAPELRRRLAEIEERMAQPGADHELLEEYERLQSELRHARRLRR